MLVDRHHVLMLIEFGELARKSTAAKLDAERDRLDAFLGTLGVAATPQARTAFEARMRGLPKDARPWSIVHVPESDKAGPPASTLVLGAEDDDPDSAEDGNRLPPREAPGWAALHLALERWDTPTIVAWIGPLGWQPPIKQLELSQDPELEASPPGLSPPLGAAASLAAQEAATRSQATLRAVAVPAALGTAAGLLLLGRALARPTLPSSKEPMS